jgi:hypothetical protein
MILSLNIKHIKLALSLLCTLVIACSPSDKPAQLIDQTEMVKILTDIHLIEAKISQLNMKTSDSSRLVFDAWEKQLFAQYKVDTTVYRQSYRYYAAHPEQFDAIYKEVIKQIEASDKKAPQQRPTR